MSYLQIHELQEQPNDVDGLKSPLSLGFAYGGLCGPVAVYAIHNVLRGTDVVDGLNTASGSRWDGLNLRAKSRFAFAGGPVTSLQSHLKTVFWVPIYSFWGAPKETPRGTPRNPGNGVPK